MGVECNNCPHPAKSHGLLEGHCLEKDCECIWSSPKASYPMIDQELVDDGCVCIDCDRRFKLGDPYKQRLFAMSAGDPIVEIICVYCSEDPSEAKIP